VIELLFRDILSAAAGI